MNDDSPLATGACVDLGKGYIIFKTDERRLKETNISHYPPVAISVADHVNGPYKMVTVNALGG